LVTPLHSAVLQDAMQCLILALAGLISLLCRKEMNMFRTISALVCTLAFVGCVNQNTWSPAVDPYNDPNASKLSVNEAECRQIAQKASGNSMQETGKGAAIGGLIGAAAGAAIGAAVGSPGKGAAVGAAAGGFGGGASQGAKSNESFQEVFKNCMKARGHTVLN
jgi:uncharacterized protein YcfJ